MKLVFAMLSIVLIGTVGVNSYGQNESSKFLYGKWAVVHTDNSKAFSQEVLEDVKELAPANSSSNFNNQVYSFKANGDFHLSSIKDYSQGDENGTYVFDLETKQISRTIQYPNYLKARAKKKVRKIKNTVLYFEANYLVLKSKKGTLYLHRIDG